MKRTIALACSLALAGQALAWDSCDNERRIDETLDVSDSQALHVIAAAGDLEVRGTSGDQVRVRATICASEEDWAEETGVDLIAGEQAKVAVVMPDFPSGWSWKGNRYVYVDLLIDVPDDLDLDIRDSSGDVDIRDTGSVSIKDSSGDIDIEGVQGAVALEDSSGDMELNDISGDVTVVHDSSGDIRGRGIDGSVIVAKDSSGDIRFRDVDGDFTVERDSSGDIVADTVGGDFTVLRDGSGDIRHAGVEGSVEIPEDS